MVCFFFSTTHLSLANRGWVQGCPGVGSLGWFVQLSLYTWVGVPAACGAGELQCRVGELEGVQEAGVSNVFPSFWV